MRLCIHESGRYLCHEDGSPFFWLGDTAWELFHKLNREEAAEYLRRRAGQGFTVVQAVLLAEQDGLRTPNRYGRLPLLSWEGDIIPDTAGDNSYWDHVDFILDEARRLNITVALVPTWGDKWNRLGGKGPEIFTPENAGGYAAWVAQRFRGRDNLVYILGGDRYFKTAAQREVIDRMGRALKENDPDTLVTFHPWGPGSSLDLVGDPDWLDFHMLQTGHFSDRDTYRLMESVCRRTEENPKPVLDGEPHYEGHPVDFEPENGRFSDWDVRQAAYWSVFSGGCGITYGSASVWGMTREDETNAFYPLSWQESLSQPGASQMRYLKELILSRPFFSRRPDQSILMSPLSWEQHLTACQGGGTVLVYNPDGQEIVLRGDRLEDGVYAVSWFCPRTGKSESAGEVIPAGEPLRFRPPVRGNRSDWVLILDKK